MQKKDIEVQKSRPSWEEDSEEPDHSLVRDTLFVSGVFQLHLRVCIHLFICNAHSFLYSPKGTISWQSERDIYDAIQAGERTGSQVRQAWVVLPGSPVTSQ